MQIVVYDEQHLAALLAYGQPPIYYGVVGQRVQALVERDFYFRNQWTGEVSARRRADTPDWWASTILGAWLGAAGFRLEASGLPTLRPVPRLAVTDQILARALVPRGLAHTPDGRLAALGGVAVRPRAV